MGRWSREELAAAFEAYQAAVRRSVAESNWDHFADMFTPDATYNEHAFGVMHGRDQIRRWVHRTMGTFPGNAMVGFPIRWSVVDEDNGWVVCDVRNLMPDPGDGSTHEASNLTVLHYAGGGLFAHEEDAYNPMNFLALALQWCRARQRYDGLSKEQQAFMERYDG